MTRRFIAGALCPKCGLQDKIVVDLATDLRECVNCGFSERRPTSAATPPRTRVNRPAARLPETPAEAITLVPGPTAGKGAGAQAEPPENQED